MTATVQIRPTILRSAAMQLRREARILFECHTIGGKWSSDHPVDLKARKEYDRMVDTATKLMAAVSAS